MEVKKDIHAQENTFAKALREETLRKNGDPVKLMADHSDELKRLPSSALFGLISFFVNRNEHFVLIHMYELLGKRFAEACKKADGEPTLLDDVAKKAKFLASDEGKTIMLLMALIEPEIGWSNSDNNQNATHVMYDHKHSALGTNRGRVAEWFSFFNFISLGESLDILQDFYFYAVSNNLQNVLEAFSKMNLPKAVYISPRPLTHREKETLEAEAKGIRSQVQDPHNNIGTYTRGDRRLTGFEARTESTYSAFLQDELTRGLTRNLMEPSAPGLPGDPLVEIEDPEEKAKKEREQKAYKEYNQKLEKVRNRLSVRDRKWYCLHPNIFNASGLTPLHIATCHGNLDLVKRLILAGADPKLRSRQSENESDESGDSFCPETPAAFAFRQYPTNLKVKRCIDYLVGLTKEYITQPISKVETKQLTPEREKKSREALIEIRAEARTVADIDKYEFSPDSRVIVRIMNSNKENPEKPLRSVQRRMLRLLKKDWELIKKYYEETNVDASGKCILFVEEQIKQAALKEVTTSAVSHMQV